MPVQDERSVSKLVDALLTEAVKAKASDIHIEPFEKTLRIRFRIDGVMHTRPPLPKEVHSKIVSRIKVMASLDVAERRLPQDGKIKISADNRSIDLRISILPSNFGEKAVIRILDPSSLHLDLTTLGFEPETLSIYERNIKRHHGIILLTGPTGSGKTTTLYSTLSTLNSEDRNILTIEDPIEYVLDGITQTQARPEIGYTFANGLRFFLRQDPDIILVGEIRDKETAEIAINAALTGHLVLSTLHTNSAAGAITRLENMGIEPYLISSAIVMVVAQRLLRVICKDCREPVEVPYSVLEKMGLEPGQVEVKDTVTLYKGKGCPHCNNTGYHGRISCYEVMELNEYIRKLILSNSDIDEINQAAQEFGMLTLQQATLKKVLAGITTIEEAMRVTLAAAE